MARHIMAVCVVCLLCAEHVPCKLHFGDDTSESGGGARGQTEGKMRDQMLTDHLRLLSFEMESTTPYNARSDDHRIVKRHHHHHDHDEEEHDSHGQATEFDRLLKVKVEQFMKKIFTEFGNPETMTMGVKGFESMMRQLDMYRLVSEDGITEGSAKSEGGSSATLNLLDGQNQQQQVDPFKCINSSDFLRRVTPPRVLSQEWEEEMAAKSDKQNYRAMEEGSTSNITTNPSISSSSSRNSNSTEVGHSDSVQNNSSGLSNESNVTRSTTDRFLVEVRIPQQEELGNSNGSSGSTGINNSSNNGNNNTSSSGSNKNSNSTIGGAAPEQAKVVQSTIMFGERDLFNVCPLLLAQLLSKVPLERAGCLDTESIPPLQVSTLLEHQDHHHHDGNTFDAAVWIYSSIAILGVSLCGLLGVVVIPCMDKHFYHHALQFLVALAVGTLCGDALLHLLPHAMMSSSKSTTGNAHDAMMYKGLAAVLGIVFFYFMERFLTVIAEWYKTREKKDKPSSRVRVMRDPESSSLHAASAGEKQCKHKYSSYPYCYDEIAMDTKDDHHEHNRTNENHNSALAKCANNHHTGEHAATEHTANEYTGLNHNHQHHHSGEEVTNTDNNTVSTNLDDGSIESEQVNNHTTTPHAKPETGGGKLRQENYTIILREHETKHHGHSHTHGHVHSPPGSLSAVAWMVIMGDGLHNFTDGMTIGAAFANNIAGGFSTAIAVFCHELPHELGDFAVLLKAGMSAKEAVYYNLLSSLLSLLGMVVGIIVGHQPDASSWVFAIAAGMFLYIAMVDMIPELTSSHGAEERCKTFEFLLQFLGLTLGFSIMMVIAMYEHDLMLMFVD